MPWNPQQYDKFKKERSAPIEDLLGMLVKRPNMQCIDLGCGTGEYTRRLFNELDNATVLGIDSSSEMLAKSAAFCCTGCSTRLMDIRQIESSYDLIFSNAALHWLPDHKGLFAMLWNHMAPGAQMLIQMPKNQKHRSHLLAAELATSMFPTIFPPSKNSHQSVLEPEDYAQILFELGAEDIQCSLRVYAHVLPDADAIVEWVKGTLLVPYMERLESAAAQAFESAYRDELRKQMSASPVLYAFKRVLISARKRSLEA